MVALVRRPDEQPPARSSRSGSTGPARSSSSSRSASASRRAQLASTALRVSGAARSA
ncbi:hypothetical protein [Streptomyces sp. CC228A]|uniref:hypothetical protein n=1 Tax=Streptomyces sp. CC228A TaxID=2898186 RepID=UPI001F4547ED|nr:hypothetical protein [Streptomyces sp. CC228A]